MANIHEGKEVLLCKKTIIITKNKTEENLAQVDEIRNSKIAYDEIKQVKCGSCNFSCLLESELRNHSEEVHGGKKHNIQMVHEGIGYVSFDCSICNGKFSQKSILGRIGYDIDSCTNLDSIHDPQLIWTNLIHNGFTGFSILLKTLAMILIGGFKLQGYECSRLT